MIWFYCRGNDVRTCEVRLINDGPGYELIIMDGTRGRTERFPSMMALLSREHELLAAWRALGWQDVTTRSPRGRQLH